MLGRSRRRGSLLTVLFMFAAASTSATVQLSREQGDQLARKIEAINKNAAVEPTRTKTTPMSEPEVNSYLVFNIRDKIPRGLSNPEIHILGDSQLTGRVFVDLDEFKRHRNSSGIVDPFNFISGQLPVTARGTLRTKNGVGQFQLATAEIHGVPLPKPLVQELVSFFSRTPEQPNGVNMDQPFDLPAKIRTITLNRGEALVVQ